MRKGTRISYIIKRPDRNYKLFKVLMGPRPRGTEASLYTGIDSSLYKSPSSRKNM